MAVSVVVFDGTHLVVVDGPPLSPIPPSTRTPLYPSPVTFPSPQTFPGG